MNKKLTKVLAFSFFAMVLSLGSLQAQHVGNGNSDNRMPDPPPFIDTNWGNPMTTWQGESCITMYANKLLDITVIINVSDYDAQVLMDENLLLYYNFGGVYDMIPLVEGEVVNSLDYPNITELKFYFPDVYLPAYCTDGDVGQDSSDDFAFNLKLLIPGGSGGHTVYQLGNSSLFPSNIFGYGSASFSMTKILCCSASMPDNQPNYSYSEQETGTIRQKKEKIIEDENSTIAQNISLNNTATFEAFPNPFQEVLNIKFNPTTEEACHLRITDVMGKEVDRKTYQPILNSENNYQIYTQNWPKGLYFLTIVQGEERKTLKVIK